MPSASIYAGVSEGLANVAQHERDRPIREARAAEATARRDLSQQQLQEHQAGAPMRQSQAELELEQLKGRLDDEQTSRLGSDMFKAFDNYEADSDTKHLNNFLASAKANPSGMAEWGDWARFDPLTRTPKSEALLGQMGITDIEGYFSDPELVKSKVLGTDTSGEQELFDMNKAYQGSGYLRFAENRTVQAQLARSRLDNALQGQQSAETNMIDKIYQENPELGYLGAAKAYHEAKNAGRAPGGAAIERIAAQLRVGDPSLSYEDSIAQASRAKAAPSSAEKDIKVIADIREQIHTAAGGDFYTADLSQPGQRERVGELIVDLEKANDKKMSDHTKKVARQLRSMIALGGKAGTELSSAETGFMDNMLHGLKKYFSDNIEGVEATAAYSTMRNVTRNALMGATLPLAELREFDRAAGTLKQQLGPVLTQLKVQLEDIKNQLQSVMDFEDPMMSKYYLGMSQDQVGTVIDEINNRLEYISGFKAKAEPGKIDMTKPVGPRKSAADRFKELKANAS